MSASTLPFQQFDTTEAQSKPTTRIDPDMQRALRVVAHCDKLIQCHPHLQGWAHGLSFRAEADQLLIIGQLPSFYLKQLAQEAIREIDWLQIDNQIVVCD